MNNLLCSHEKALINDICMTNNNKIKISYLDFNDKDCPYRTMYYDTFKEFIKDIRSIKNLYWIDEIRM